MRRWSIRPSGAMRAGQCPSWQPLSAPRLEVLLQSPQSTLSRTQGARYSLDHSGSGTYERSGLHPRT